MAESGQSFGDQRRNGLLRAGDMAEEVGLVEEGAEGGEAFGLVGAAAADEDFDGLGLEVGFDLVEGADETGEGGADVGEVGYSPTDDEDFGVIGRGEEEVDDLARIEMGFVGGGIAGVFAVVG